MSQSRRWLIVLAVLLIAALLAFPLRETIHAAIVIPAAFIGWELGLLYHSVAQVIWWWLIIIGSLFLLAFSVVPQFRFSRKNEPKPKPRYGQVEDLANWLGRAHGGVYFKWLIANRLGKLAYQILLHRESGRVRSVFAPLLGADWEPSKELQNYLETGLHGSFADFPNPRHPLSAPAKTPLDYEVSAAIQFLESQVENSNPR